MITTKYLFNAYRTMMFQKIKDVDKNGDCFDYNGNKVLSQVKESGDELIIARSYYLGDRQCNEKQVYSMSDDGTIHVCIHQLGIRFNLFDEDVEQTIEIEDGMMVTILPPTLSGMAWADMVISSLSLNSLSEKVAEDFDAMRLSMMAALGPNATKFDQIRNYKPTGNPVYTLKNGVVVG